MICDICDKKIDRRSELVRLHVQGVSERINTHSACADILLRCHGDFHKLPDGKLKRAILLSVGSDVEITNTHINITRKQRLHIIEGLRSSHAEGMHRIHDLAVIMYNLKEPADGEYYTLNCESQLILMKKSSPI